MNIESFEGSCHCGAVAYSARLDPNAGTSRCNCSICTKSRAWIAPIPAGDFELVRGAEASREYRFGAGTIVHAFCSRCGIKTHGRILEESGEDGMVAVCVSTLDLTPDQFAAIPIAYADGRADAPDRQPDLFAYL